MNDRLMAARGSGSALVLGEALIDVFADARRIGGAPFNVARVLAALGLRVSFVSRVGQRDAGSREILDSARRYALSCDGMQLDPERPTGVVKVTSVGPNNRFHIAEDSAWDHIAAQPALSLAHKIKPSLVYFGTLAQRHPTSRASLREVLQAGPSLRYLDLNLRGDPADLALAHDSLMLAHWVKVNEDELAQLLAWFESGWAARLRWGGPGFERSVASLIRRFELQHLIVTRGAKGYASFDGNGQLRACKLGVQNCAMVDTVGAGDGFSAMLIAATLVGCSQGDALSLANEFAAQVCGWAGALPSDPEPILHWRTRLAELVASTAAQHA